MKLLPVQGTCSGESSTAAKKTEEKKAIASKSHVKKQMIELKGIQLKEKGDFEIHPSQIGMLPLGQISSFLQKSGREILENRPSSQIFHLQLSLHSTIVS